MGERVHKHKHKHKRKHSDSVTTCRESDVPPVCDGDRAGEEVSAVHDGDSRCLNEGIGDGKRKHKHKKHGKDEDGAEVPVTVSRIEESSSTALLMESRKSKKSKKRKHITEDDEVTGVANAGSDRDPVSMETVNGDSGSEHKAKRMKIANEQSVQVNGEQFGRSGSEEQVQEKSPKSKKRVKTGKVPTSQGGGVGKESALQYLHSWKEKDKWSFKKKIQYWLLLHMYDKHQVPKTEFKILLRYLEGLQGNQRGLVVARAQRFLEEGEEERKTEDPGIKKRVYKRAVKILRVLA